MKESNTTKTVEEPVYEKDLNGMKLTNITIQKSRTLNLEGHETVADRYVKISASVTADISESKLEFDEAYTILGDKVDDILRDQGNKLIDKVMKK